MVEIIGCDNMNYILSDTIAKAVDKARICGDKNIKKLPIIMIEGYDDLNPWINFKVYVQESRRDAAIEAIRNAADEFWNDGGHIAYGDAVELQLDKADIPHASFYRISDTDVPDPDFDKLPGGNENSEIPNELIEF